MRTLDDALDQFVQHPPNPATAHQQAAVRDLLVHTVWQLWDLVPDCPEKTLALRKLQEAGMYANLAITVTALTDTLAAHAAAQALPDPATMSETDIFAEAQALAAREPDPATINPPRDRERRP